MRARGRLVVAREGSAAVEMALVTPLLLILLFGCIELGNYFMNEHALLSAVRDGARYAARQSFDQYAGCNGTAANVPTAVADNTKLIVQKGSLDSTAADLLPNWSSGSTVFAVTMTCVTTAGGTAIGGIYSGNSVGTVGAAPAVVVSARLPYRPILESFGFRGTNYFINASQQAAVAGI